MYSSMDKITYSTKRKKRRTRRCLDEIRNRLRRKCGNSLEHSIQNTKTKSCILESKKLQNSLVTMDRLTLKAMFPNAIRSETITRPVLEEIKKKQNAVVDVTEKAILLLDQEFLCNNMNTSASFHSASFTECGKNYMLKNYKNDEIKSFSSKALLSPVSSLNKAGTLSKSVNTVAATTSSSETSQDYKHRRYEELMNEIPSYLRHLASYIANDDGIKKTINILQKLYMESRQKECEENIMKSNGENNSTSKTFCIENQVIVENPLDYIRLEHGRRQNRGFRSASLSTGAGAPCASPPCLSDGAEEARVPATPCTFPPGISGGSERARAHASSHTSTPRLRGGTFLYDTPDYTYYPHPMK